VAPDCAEDNPWNSEDVTSFYERFHPFEFGEQVRDLLSEFRYVATAMGENCLGDDMTSECRETVLRGGVLLRHVDRVADASFLDTLSQFNDVLDEIDTLRKHIACTNFSESESMINVLHSTHYEIQRPARRKMLIKLAETWYHIPRMFISE